MIEYAEEQLSESPIAGVLNTIATNPCELNIFISKLPIKLVKVSTDNFLIYFIECVLHVLVTFNSLTRGNVSTRKLKERLSTHQNSSINCEFQFEN